MGMASLKAVQNLIGGKLVPSTSGATLHNIEPATGIPYSSIPQSNAHDVEAAIEAATKAFPEWSIMPESKRAQSLRKFSNLLEANLEKFAHAESVDTGKPISLARRVDIPRAIKNFSYFADTLSQFSSESYQSQEMRSIHYTLRQPLGVVGCISPWNLPLYLLTWKIVPALATGNTVVAKPSEVTPMTAYMLSELSIEAGLPPGVLNIVHGTGPEVGAPLVAHKDIKAVSFTGSTKTGAGIAQIAGPQFKKVSLELGGKNANIIFADSNKEKAIETAVRAAFTNQGQICLCGSRILIEKSIYPEVKQAFIERAKKLIVGDPLDEKTDQGSLVSKLHFEKVASLVERAKEEGGKILIGGSPVKLSGRCAEGYFYTPTFIEGLDATCATNQEEIFGPVATLIPFDTEDEAISIANCTPYGLSASVWTENIERAHRVAHNLQAGVVWINCWMVRDLRTPFGGVKQSGVGREGGLDVLRFFTESKSVTVPY